MYKNAVCSIGLFITPLILTGCPAPSGLELYPVTGTVTFEGKPIDTGRIQFRTASEERRSFSAAIENGNYEIETLTGPMTVEVRASRLIEGKFDKSNPDELTPAGEMYIPQKYNSRTELTADVPAGGDTIDFNLLGS
ncbi:hypothetical protein [Rhodopirellula europaea]|jgi:hypothetical protein|uniref:hypothetical protein n=1 Tax=Rhodopirellula europaea TaxID=1263866 RepID=UPI001F1BD1BA|nr:hypothetical protein [Rhodopirellula europaea]MCR9210011.1 hypothetical protein [bacterium]|tara:strand:- start:24877 stop:25287 length:411 start_codon:yes stop_codon:yes gene_type:complete